MLIRMFNYEDFSNEIDQILVRKKHKWFLPYPSYDDISQIIRKHIWVKWEQWRQDEPFGRWANRVVENQLINLRRNYHGKLAPPCNDGCVYNMGDDRCSFTSSGKKCAQCPMYRDWEKKKKDGYHISFASSIEELMANGGNIAGQTEDNFDMQKSLTAFHEKMKEVLPEKLYKIYEIIYINNESEAVVSKMLGLQNNEKSVNAKRVPGYKIIFLYKQQIFEKAQEVIKDFDLIK